VTGPNGYYGRCIDCGFTTTDPEALAEHQAVPCPSIRDAWMDALDPEQER
jgi:hypothetical protein